MPVWNYEMHWSTFLLVVVKVILSGGVEDQNPKAAGWVEKYQINLDADISMARDMGERSVLVWHHNLLDMILGASCGLEVSEIVLSGKTKEELKKLG